MGIVFHIFSKSGNVPVDKDKLKRRASGLDMSSLRRCNRWLGMLLGPHTFPKSKKEIIVLISASSQRWSAIEFGFDCGR